MVLGLCLTVSAPAMAVTNIYGPGGISCDKYNQVQDPAAKDAFRYWAQGYVSGINSMKNMDVSRAKDWQAIFMWIDTYCRTNPQSSYNGAVDTFIIELNKKNP